MTINLKLTQCWVHTLLLLCNFSYFSTLTCNMWTYTLKLFILVQFNFHKHTKVLTSQSFTYYTLFSLALAPFPVP